MHNVLIDSGSNSLWLTSDKCFGAVDDEIEGGSPVGEQRCDNVMSKPYRVEDSAVGRFYESVITGTDGSQLTYYMQERSEAGEVEIKYG